MPRLAPPGRQSRVRRGGQDGGGGWYFTYEGPLGAKARSFSQAWSVYRKNGAVRRGDGGTAQRSDGDQRHHFATKTGRPVHEMTAAEKETVLAQFASKIEQLEAQVASAEAEGKPTNEQAG